MLCTYHLSLTKYTTCRGDRPRNVYLHIYWARGPIWRYE